MTDLAPAATETVGAVTRSKIPFCGVIAGSIEKSITPFVSVNKACVVVFVSVKTILSY